jgi:photolyase PhrII
MDTTLPGPLHERIKWRSGPTSAISKQSFILCWIHNALRAHENPALDVAICFARQNRLPLLVYHGLGEAYAYASDRHHAFMLQGHRDFQKDLKQRKIASVFDFQSKGQRGRHLLDLTHEAALLITDEMPVEPIRGWLSALESKTETPIATVDASCVVPTTLLDTSYTRAFQFRDATKRFYAERTGRIYVEQNADCRMFDGSLPLENLDLQDACLSALIAKCKIDHAVAPVADTPGGTEAGYQRWQQFKDHGLGDYAKKRNDATKHKAVSRLSAYLHYGMVSPFRIAREAKALNADKFLDELLIWRELSFHFCARFDGNLDSFDAIPDWAKKTLLDHRDDTRDANFSWEKLARGRTGQQLWDWCQQSLLRHGELHNNLRMTWGKAILPWTNDPQEALRLTVDLNHRYALDGRDPNSYGGILWCYGQFDRPFAPEENVFGSVRSRSLEQHARRLDTSRYRQLVDRSIAADLPRVAVVGAGMAGLFAARTLHDHGLDVTVFDKSRGVGGRMSHRRVNETLSFDHGAQYFTARDPRFKRYVDSWRADGIVAPWNARIVELASSGKVIKPKSGTDRFVPVGGMNQIGKHLAEDLKLALGNAVTSLQGTETGWLVHREEGETTDPFDAVVINCPPLQTRSILKGQASFSDRLADVKMQPCWAVMLVCSGLQTCDFDGAFINEGPLSWIARDSSKPRRPALVPPDQAAWVLHASAEWSAANLDLDPQIVTKQLLHALESATGSRLGEVTHCVAHRWMYAIPKEPLIDECLWDAENQVGACGDWCGGPRVEGAFLSGMAMAGTLLREITIDQRPHQPTRMIQPSLL